MQSTMNVKKDITDTDAGTGTTAPEQGTEASNLVGRPSEEAPTGFKAPHSGKHERQRVDHHASSERGGSFDNEGVPPKPGR